MDKTSFQPLAGFRDLVSPTKRWVLERLEKIFQLYGYQPLETPALERQEILLGKLGSEAQKQLYLFTDNGQRQVGLRYDLTVPLARYVAANYQSLILPFKRYEIGPVWRAEKPQRGRYRQFTQADIDIVGSSSLGAETEILQIIKAVECELGLVFRCLINDRKIVGAVLAKLAVSQSKWKETLIILDKREKVKEEKTLVALQKLGLNADQRGKMAKIFFSQGDLALAAVRNLIGSRPELDRLENLIHQAKKLRLMVVFDPAMVRGLDYYTGTIIEGVTKDDGNSVLGGGRYDSLVESLIGRKIPAVGLSFGVDRLADLLAAKSERGLMIVNLPEIEEELIDWANKLRSQGKAVELYLDSAVELGKQLRYADKQGYREVILPLRENWENGEVIVKNLASGEQVVKKITEL